MDEYRNQVEAALFAAGKKMSLQEIARLCRTKNTDIIKEALLDLKKDYDGRNTSLMVVNEGENWKLTVREKYLLTVQKIVADTELSKTMMETLSVVAYKAPCLQSDIIKIRTNKAYDHLDILEETGYIKRIKHGRTKKIMLTQHFYDYFDITDEKLKSTFDGISEVEKLIKAKEDEIEHKQQKKQAAEQPQDPNEKTTLSIGPIQEEKPPPGHDTALTSSESAPQEPQPSEQSSSLTPSAELTLPEVDLLTEQGTSQKLEIYSPEENDEENDTDNDDNTTPLEVEVIPNSLGPLPIVEDIPKKKKKHARVIQKQNDEPPQPTTSTPIEAIIEEPAPTEEPTPDDPSSIIEKRINERVAALTTKSDEAYQETNSLIDLARERSSDNDETFNSKENAQKKKLTEKNDKEDEDSSTP